MAKKIFHLEDFLVPLQEDLTYSTKRMFGGLAIYYNGQMVLCLAEKAGERTWGDIEYDFDVWNGVMLCTSRVHHSALKKEIKALIPHPIVKKWLYLPMSSGNFEKDFDTIVNLILNKNNLIGILPNTKSTKTK